MKKKKKLKKIFNYVSKEMLELIITNTDFLSGCVLAMNSHFFKTFRIQKFLINPIINRKLGKKS